MEHSLLIIKVNIGDGREDYVYVNEEDDPRLLSEIFCEKWGLPSKVQVALSNEIESHLNNLEVKPIKRKVKCTPVKTVHERLFDLSKSKIEENKDKDKRFLSPSIAKRLYYEGMRKKDILNKKLQDFREKKEEEQTKEAVFKPNVNRNRTKSRYMLGKIEWKLEKARKEQLKVERESCTFSPEIDRNSSRIALKKRNDDTYQELYQNASHTRNKIDKRNKKLIEEECPFSPDIQRTASANKALLSRKKRRCKKEETQEETDPTFRPKTGRPPSQRKFKPSEIGNHLYAMSFKELKKDEESPGFTENEQSRVILRKLKIKKYRDIFEKLCPTDGKIFKDNLEDSELPEDIISLISPLLQEVHEPMNFQEFTENMDLFIKILNPSERNRILNTSKRTQSATKFPFKPEIKSDFRYVSPIYERGVKKMREDRVRREKERIGKFLMEFGNCTFKPSIS